MLNENNPDKLNRQKEIKLLHLDHVQREVLEIITEKFINHANISLSDIADAFSSYVTRLVRMNLDKSKTIFVQNMALSQIGDISLKKFCDAILICTKSSINYNKIFALQEIKEILLLATNPMNNNREYYITTLSYRVKLALYNLLEADNNKIVNYIQDTKDFYYKSLVMVNPYIAKKTFIDNIINALYINRNARDIYKLFQEYQNYLKKSFVDHNKIDNLISKYYPLNKNRSEALVQSAKVEIFKILEGI